MAKRKPTVKERLDALPDMAPAEEVEALAREHDACEVCGGAGGDSMYPEVECQGCGLTVWDSYGLENVKR